MLFFSSLPTKEARAFETAIDNTGGGFFLLPKRRRGTTKTQFGFQTLWRCLPTMGDNAQGSRNVYKSPSYCIVVVDFLPSFLPSFLFHCFLYNYLPSSAAAVFPANIYLMDQSPPPYRHTGCLTKSAHNSSPVLGGSDNLTAHGI